MRTRHIITYARRAQRAILLPAGAEKLPIVQLQFQKQLRLQEARRLLLAGETDVARAGYRVGYEDPSHFSREYKRLFGKPPTRDVARLQRLTAILAMAVP